MTASPARTISFVSQDVLCAADRFGLSRESRSITSLAFVWVRDFLLSWFNLSAVRPALGNGAPTLLPTPYSVLRDGGVRGARVGAPFSNANRAQLSMHPQFEYRRFPLSHIPHSALSSPSA
eukprot:scaffold128558_cov40-Tisochrysis_lutea.AAC.3